MRKGIQYMWLTFRALRKFVVVLILLVSLAFNIAVILSSTVAALASGAIAAVTGARTVFLRQADEIAELSTAVDAERMVSRELRSEVASVTGDLNAERMAHRQTRGELAEATADLATSSRIVSSEAREAASDIVEGISERTARTARRELAAMSGESIPFWGTAIIVGATTLELHDMCQNIQDLNELQRLIDPSAGDLEEGLTVCSMSVPTRNEIWEAARNSPQRVWGAARDAMPTAEEISSLELPEINWTDLGDSISDNAGDWTNTATETLIEAGEWIERWWND